MTIYAIINELMFIDTHAHLTFPEFQIDLQEVIRRAKETGLEAIVNIALDEEAIRKSIKLAEEYPEFIYNALGLHPHDASEWNEKSYETIKNIIKTNKIIALGETGLDYHYKLSPIEKQKEVFSKLLALAQEVDLPAIIHSREAGLDTLRILHEENKGKLRGVLHCFSGNLEMLKEALEMGFYISFTANITFPKTEKLKEKVKAVPLERLLIETDCPFLAPQLYRGKRNEPAYVVEVAKNVAEIKKLSSEEVAIQTTKNAKKLFNLS